MNMEIYIIECVLLCLVFGVFVMGSLLKNPEPWVSDYPPDIQKRHYQFLTNQEKSERNEDEYLKNRSIKSEHESTENVKSEHTKNVKSEHMTMQTIIRKTAGIIIFLILFAWMVHMAGGDTFTQALRMSYGYMLVIFAFDTFFLDWVLFANIKKLRLPGTEDMDQAYHQKWFHVKACLPMIPVFAVGGVVIAGLVILIW